jgi:alpha-N-arabinofuranosidase
MNLYLWKRKKYIITLLGVIALNGYSQNTVTFNVTDAKSVVAQEVFGVLMEIIGRQWTGQNNSGIFCGTGSSIPNTNGMRNDIIEGFKECGVGAAQWPGGCAANTFRWQDNKNPSKDVGVDRFIQFCKLTGAEAVISLKPSAEDVASNLAFVRYIINDLKYQLKWVKIGNEIWGGCNVKYTDGYTSTAFPQNVTKLKDLRNTENGKNLKIIAAAGTSEGNYSWISGYYSSLGSQMDAIEYHDYIFFPDNISSTNPTTQNYWTIMNAVFTGDFHGHLFNNIIPAMKAADPACRVKIDFDEWGDWLMDVGDVWMQDITVMDAISAAGHLHQFIQNADIVGIACLAQGVSVIHSIMNINTDGIMVKTPVFYIFKMFKHHHSNGAKFCPIKASSYEKVNGSVPAINVTATVDNNDTVNVSFVNVDLAVSRDVTVSLTSNKGPYKIVTAEVVTGSQYTSKNPFGETEQVNIQPLNAPNYRVEGTTLNVKLPSKSVVMVRLVPVTVRNLKPVENNIEKVFHVRTGSDGAVHISCSEKFKSPLAINMYTADGKIVNDTRSMSSSDFSIGNNLGKGAYLVKISGDNINLSRLIIFAN